MCRGVSGKGIRTSRNPCNNSCVGRALVSCATHASACQLSQVSSNPCSGLQALSSLEHPMHWHANSRNSRASQALACKLSGLMRGKGIAGKLLLLSCNSRAARALACKLSYACALACKLSYACTHQQAWGRTCARNSSARARSCKQTRWQTLATRALLAEGRLCWPNGGRDSAELALHGARCAARSGEC